MKIPSQHMENFSLSQNFFWAEAEYSVISTHVNSGSGCKNCTLSHCIVKGRRYYSQTFNRLLGHIYLFSNQLKILQPLFPLPCWCEVYKRLPVAGAGGGGAGKGVFYSRSAGGWAHPPDNVYIRFRKNSAGIDRGQHAGQSTPLLLLLLIQPTFFNFFPAAVFSFLLLLTF